MLGSKKKEKVQLIQSPRGQELEFIILLAIRRGFQSFGSGLRTFGAEGRDYEAERKEDAFPRKHRGHLDRGLSQHSAKGGRGARLRDRNTLILPLRSPTAWPSQRLLKRPQGSYSPGR